MELLGIFVIALASFITWVALSHYRYTSDPRSRCFGVVVRRPDAFDAVADVVGRYMGLDIYERVIFKGMTYLFDRVAPPGYKDKIRGGELFLEPGLVYIAQPIERSLPRR